MKNSHVTIEVPGINSTTRKLLKKILSIPGKVVSAQIFGSTTRVRKDVLDAAFSHLEELELGSKVALTSTNHMKVREKLC